MLKPKYLLEQATRRGELNPAAHCKPEVRGQVESVKYLESHSVSPPLPFPSFLPSFLSSVICYFPSLPTLLLPLLSSLCHPFPSIFSQLSPACLPISSAFTLCFFFPFCLSLSHFLVDLLSSSFDSSHFHFFFLFFFFFYHDLRLLFTFSHSLLSALS